MKIAYVNVFVSDLEKAVAFYTQTLGLVLEQSSAEHGYASFSGGPVRLGLAVAGQGSEELVGRHTGVGFDVSDLDSEHRRLANAGVKFDMPPTRQPWGGYMAMFSDPDENVFYLDQISAAHG